MATPHKLVDVNDAASCDEATAWWTALTSSDGKGMVVKPHDFISKGRGGYAHPAVICRGPESLLPKNLELLRSRDLGANRSFVSREFALGIESLEVFVLKEPLRRTHECAFGVLALESEFVDPRL